MSKKWNNTEKGGRDMIFSARTDLAIEASAMVGALIYTFSDTFWFSAVEGEVYAYSSAFTAVVFWLILKWEDHADEPHSDRWLVLIMYMTGLSIGVHLLNLLCLPAIVLVYYYKRFPTKDSKKEELVSSRRKIIFFCPQKTQNKQNKQNKSGVHKRHKRGKRHQQAVAGVKGI